jgi:hypothetical protein
MLLRVSAAYASTMLILLISSTKVLTVVTGMLNTSSGRGPAMLRFLYTRYVAISEPKNMQSDPRNAHMRTFLWFRPVVVGSCSPWAVACAT